MKLSVNGKYQEVRDGQTIIGLLEFFSVEETHVVIEYNDQLLQRDEWAGLVLAEGDRLEIIRYVGGGSVLGLPDCFDFID